MSKNKKIIPATAIDVGSGRVKIAYSLDNYRILSSYLCLPTTPFTQGNYFETRIKEDLWVLPADSVIVEYIDGDNESLIGKTWLLGDSAKEFEDEPSFPLFDTEKTDFAAHALLASIVQPGEEEENLICNHVSYCLPFIQDEDKIKKAVLGQHKIRIFWPKVNEAGVSTGQYSRVYNVRIDNLHVVGEGVTPHKWIEYRQKGNSPILNFKEKSYAIIDEGTQTTILTIITYDKRQGYILKPGAKVVDPDGGMQSLARRVQRRLESRGLYLDRIDLILQGIEDKSYTYGQNEDINFEKEFRQEHKAWFTEFKNKLKIRWGKSFNHEIAEVLLIGGGASALKGLEKWEIKKEYIDVPSDDIPITEKRFHRCPIEQEGNVLQVLSMYYHLYYEVLGAKDVILTEEE